MNHFYAWLSLVMSIFVGITIVREFYKGAQARAYGTGEKFHEAIVNLTMRNTRRYGGYIIHFGFVLLFVGWSGQAFSEKVRLPDSQIGDHFQIHQYDMRVEDMGVRARRKLSRRSMRPSACTSTARKSRSCLRSGESTAGAISRARRKWPSSRR